MIVSLGSIIVIALVSDLLMIPSIIVGRYSSCSPSVLSISFSLLASGGWVEL